MLYQNYESLDIVQKIGRRVLEISGILRLNQELYEYNEHAFVDSCEPSKILNEKEIIIHILNIKNINELLELLDDLNYRLTRVKTFNSSLEFEIFNF